MTEREKNLEPERVSCEICLKEVPKSDAKNAEVHDYTLHFCGLECYGKWQKQEEKEKV